MTRLAEHFEAEALARIAAAVPTEGARGYDPAEHAAAVVLVLRRLGVFERRAITAQARELVAA